MDQLIDFLLNFYGPTPYFLIFGILLGCGLGLPIPEDVTLVAGGVLSYYGMTEVSTMILAALAGVLLGDSIIFFLGARFGRKLTRTWVFGKIIPEDRLNYVQAKFRKRGNRMIFLARFMPGFRAPIFFSAASLGVPYRIFLFYDGGAALISVPLIIVTIFIFGDELDRVVRWIQRVEHGILFVIAAVVLAIAAKWYVTHRKVKLQQS